MVFGRDDPFRSYPIYLSSIGHMVAIQYVRAIWPIGLYLSEGRNDWGDEGRGMPPPLLGNTFFKATIPFSVTIIMTQFGVLPIDNRRV